MDVFEIMKKPPIFRSNNDIKKIGNYLNSLESFVEIFKNSDPKYINEIMKNIATNINIEFLNENNLLFRYGDKGKLFYIILSGKICIIVPAQEKFYMTEEEYISYLLKLRRNSELELLSKTINANNDLIQISSDFDSWMNNQIPFQNSNEIKLGYKKFTLQINVESNVNIDGKSDNINWYRIGKNSDLIQLIQNTITIINQKDYDEKLLLCSPEEYVERSRPNLIQLEKSGIEEKKLFTIFVYNVNNYFGIGQNFGNLAFDSKFHKRNATIIASEDTHLGIIDKMNYDKCLKEINEKTKRQFLSFVFEYEVFKEFSKITFEKRYFCYFKYQQLKRGSRLLIENNPTACIYFLKGGEFEITINRSILEINDLIYDIKNDPLLKKKLENELLKEKQFNDESFNTNFLTRKHLRIGIIKDREILGLYEYLHQNLDKKSQNNIPDFNFYQKRLPPNSFFTITCLSNNGETYFIPNELFKDIYSKEKVIREHTGIFYHSKKMFLIERLENFIKTQYDLYRKKIRNSSKKISNMKIESDKAKEQYINITTESKFQQNLRLKSNSIDPKSIKTQFQLKDSFNYDTNNTINCKKIIRSKLKLPTLKSIISSNLEDSVYKPTNANCLIQHEVTSTNDNYLKKYKFNVINKNLFNDIFTRYLTTEPNQENSHTHRSSNTFLKSNNKVKRISFRNNNGTPTAFGNSNTISCYFDSIPTTARLLESERQSSNVKIVDPLVMDKFERIYHTIYYSTNSNDNTLLLKNPRSNYEAKKIIMQSKYNNSVQYI